MVYQYQNVFWASSGRKAPSSQTESADVLPSSPQTPRRSDAAVLADELASCSGRINRPRFPEIKEFKQMAEMIPSARYNSSEELADASSAERTQLYKIFLEGRAG